MSSIKTVFIIHIAVILETVSITIFQLKLVGHNKCLHQNKSKLESLECNNGIQQQWMYHNLNQSIVNLKSNLCLNIDKAEYEDDSSVYASVQLYECNGLENQKWIIKQNIITNVKGKWVIPSGPQKEHLFIKEFRL